MWRLFFWAFLIVSIHARPQNHQHDQSNPNPNVEIQSHSAQDQNQDLLYVKTFNMSMRDDESQRKIEESTKEILEKIEALNKKQGLMKKKKPSYFHFPFSYSRSQQERNTNYNNFKFPTSPFANPIFDYLEQEKGNENENENNDDAEMKFKSSATRLPGGGLSITQTNPSAEITEDDRIPGQFIKRKITHQQTILVPNFMNRFPAQQQQFTNNFEENQSPPRAVINQYITNNPVSNQSEKPGGGNRNGNLKNRNKFSNLEKQTVNNIRNIIFNSPNIPNTPYNPNQNLYNPNFYSPQFYAPSTRNGNGFNNYNFEPPALQYGPYIVPNYNPNLNGVGLGRQFQSPLNEYFPIVIKDPIIQLYNAFTSMIEYGSNGGAPMDGCKHQKPKENPVGKDENAPTPTTPEAKEPQDVLNPPTSPEDVEKFHYIALNSTKDFEHVLANLTENGNLTILELGDGRTITSRSAKRQDKVTVFETDRKLNNSLDLSKYNIKKNHDHDHEHDVDIVDDEEEEGSPKYVRISPRPPNSNSENSSKTLRKSPSNPAQSDQIQKGIFPFGRPTPKPTFNSEETQISHEGHKKFISKDNTGSGIFIQRLKVRKGGVAIAGPGGIATAGEGGTAIVGPNGYAYTKPDSLAIAGTGTKVVAVEPSINLGELLKNNSNSRTGAFAQRVGKVVAVGPVIYYNKG